MGRPPRVLWLAVEPTPYLAHEFQDMSATLPYEFEYVYLGPAWTQPWSAEIGTVLSGPGGCRAGLPAFARFLAARLGRPPELAVLEGYGLPHFVMAAIVLSAVGIPWVLRSDTPLWRNGKRRSLPRRALAGWMVGHASYLLPGGTRQAESFLDLGADPARMVCGYMCVDTERFRRPAGFAVGGSGTLRLVTVGRLVPRKRVDLVIAAVLRARERGFRVALTVVGDGPERPTLEAQARGSGGSVAFTGFLATEEIAERLWMSDAFILLSEEEPWGLVVNEALSAGLPLVLDREIGCVPDLLEDRANGFVVDASDDRSVDEAIAAMASDAGALSRMSRASSRIAEVWGPDQRRESARRAITECLSPGVR
jgi:glycosyltransferase involved in cell wall biosynthesis